MLIVELENCDEDRRKSFSTAMSRRGWWKVEDAANGYRIGFSNATDDDEVVQICERDVRESAYVAGVARYDATCLIAPDDSAADSGRGLGDSGGRPDFDDLP